MSWLVFLLCLPVAVYYYACILALFDTSRKVLPLVRLVALSCVLLAIATWTNPEYLTPMVLSIVTIIGIHWISFFSIRTWGLGMPTYSNRPPLETPDEDPDTESL